MSSRSLLARSLRPRLCVCRAQPAPLSTRIRLLSTLPNTPIFRALQAHDRDSLAIAHSASSRSFTYGNLVADVLRAKESHEQKAARAGIKLAGERIAFLAENSYEYVGACKQTPCLRSSSPMLTGLVTLLAIFASDAIALPLSPAFPTGELQYILNNSSAKVLIATEKYAEKADHILKAGLEHEPLVDIKQNLKEGVAGSETVQLKDLDQPSSGGIMLYTSGTTNRPVRYPQHFPSRSFQSCISNWCLRENQLIAPRKVFSSQTPRSLRKQPHSSRPGNTRLKTVCCTSSRCTTSTVS